MFQISHHGSGMSDALGPQQKFGRPKVIKRTRIFDLLIKKKQHMFLYIDLEFLIKIKLN